LSSAPAKVVVVAGHSNCRCSHALAYTRQGMNPVRRWHHGVDWRWCSLGRWAAQIEAWWPGLPDSLEGLLIGLGRRAGSTDPPALLAAAAASHVRRGSAM
jgi:hypothetical protein